MKEFPILFSDALVPPILTDRKTQTRRLLSPSRCLVDGVRWAPKRFTWLRFNSAVRDSGPSPVGNPGPYLHCPMDGSDTVHRVYPIWQPGDRLWVKHTWYLHSAGIDSWDEFTGICRNTEGDSMDWRGVLTPQTAAQNLWTKKHPWFMPRWASSITLEVVKVRIQRLHEIDEADARAEGAEPNWVDDLKGFDPDVHGFLIPCPVHGRDGCECSNGVTAREWIEWKWDRIHGKTTPWASNPWVIATTFRRIIEQVTE